MQFNLTCMYNYIKTMFIAMFKAQGDSRNNEICTIDAHLCTQYVKYKCSYVWCDVFMNEVYEGAQECL